ncbi:complement C1s subcomponent-like [Protopterus annectens]|uniref:complement C1s subcomponent-like n=1 Tax=Protopterus annectens TaxID=7888 RepID=UPI001CFAACBD|nr:complement C1s subcomponent-like [Protopterus annectens]
MLVILITSANCNEPNLYGEIQSPNYPQGYPDDVHQTWNIKVPEGFKIRIYFTHVDIEISENCEYDYVKISAEEQQLDLICGRMRTSSGGNSFIRVTESPFNLMTVTFHSDFSNQERFTGFMAYYIAVDINECEDSYNGEEACTHYCNNYIGGFVCTCRPGYFLQEDRRTCGVNCSVDVYTELAGVITSPGYPETYPENSKCEYKVQLEDGYQVVLYFEDLFDVEKGEDAKCSQDVLKIEAGKTTFGPYCEKPVSPIETRINRIKIKFDTDGSGDNKGWKIRYKASGMAVGLEAVVAVKLFPVEQGLIPSASIAYLFDSDQITYPDSAPGPRSPLEIDYQKLMTKFWNVLGRYPENLLNRVRVKVLNKREQADNNDLLFAASCIELAHLEKKELIYLSVSAVDCGPPKEIENGNLIYLTLFDMDTYEARIHYLCEELYYQLQKKGSGIYQCDAQGSWRNPDLGTAVPTCIPVCGNLTNPPQPIQRIIKGEFAEKGNFPWQVFFEEPRGGGALIGEQWVLTAAHIAEHNQFTMYIGTTNVGREALKAATEIKSEKVFLHPNYTMVPEEKRYNYDNDIALIKLKEKVKMGYQISPICIPNVGEEFELQQEKMGFISGWGRIAEEGRLSQRLRYAEIPVEDMKACKHHIFQKNEPEAKKYVFTDNMFCAGLKGMDSCHGDSGGAYAFKSDDNTYFVGGIVSWGVGCGSYGFYTKTNNYIEWLEKVMKNEEVLHPFYRFISG